jgi:hypothetical protein
MPPADVAISRGHFAEVAFVRRAPSHYAASRQRHIIDIATNSRRLATATPRRFRRAAAPELSALISLRRAAAYGVFIVSI